MHTHTFQLTLIFISRLILVRNQVTFSHFFDPENKNSCVIKISSHRDVFTVVVTRSSEELISY